MFPLNWNIPFIRKNGSRTTLGAITGDIAGLTDKTECLWANMKNNGAVNRLEITATTNTIRGITYQINSDKSVTLSGIVDTGTDSYCDLATNLVLPKGTWKLTGGVSSKVFIYVGSQYSEADTGNGYVFTSDGTTALTRVRIVVSKGTDLTTPITIYPMISVASYNGDYVPYAKSNKELTENGAKVEEISFTYNSSIVSGSSVAHITKQGKIVVFEGYVTISSAVSRGDLLFTNIGAIPIQNYTYVYLLNDNGNAYLIRFKKDGTLIVESQTGLPATSYALVGSAIVQ